MNKTLTVALSMCAGVAMVGAGVFASSTGTTTNTGTTNVSSSTRQGIVKQFKKFNGGDRVQSETIKAAIEANDYSKLSATEQTKITKEQFTQMVTMNKARATHEAAVLAAVKANDFTAFQKAQTEFKAIIQKTKGVDTIDDQDEDADTGMRKKESRGELDTTLTDAQKTQMQQARFDELVSYYKTNGKLPEMKMGMGGHDRGGHDKGGMMMSDTVKSAVEANDYSKLSTTEQSKITKDQFAKMVTMNKAMTSHQTTVETAVKANDFTAFKKAHADFKAIMDANKPADAPTNDHPTPTDAELKTRFDEMVTYYKANGKLPEMKMGMGGQKGGKGMMKGMMRGESQNQSAQ